jgi:hypothetical protein
MPGSSKIVSGAFGHDEGDVVVLLGGAERLDGRFEEFFFGGHGLYGISTFGAGLAGVLCEFNKAAQNQDRHY